MTSVFDPANTTTEYGTQPQPLAMSLDFESLLNLPTSPTGSTGYASETSSVSNCQRLHSPAASLVSAGASSGCDQPLGAESPSHSPLVTSTFSHWSPHAGQDMAEKRNSGSDFGSVWSASPGNNMDNIEATSTPVSNDVMIDVGTSEGGEGRREGGREGGGRGEEGGKEEGGREGGREGRRREGEMRGREGET